MRVPLVFLGQLLFIVQFSAADVALYSQKVAGPLASEVEDAYPVKGCPDTHTHPVLRTGGGDRLYSANDDSERHFNSTLPKCDGAQMSDCQAPACVYNTNTGECRWRDCANFDAIDCDTQYGCFYDGGQDTCRQLQCRDHFQESSCDATAGCVWLFRKCHQSFDRVPRHVLMPVDDPPEIDTETATGADGDSDESDGPAGPLPNPHAGMFAFDEEAAHRYARYCATMYCEEEAVKNMTCGLCTGSQFLTRLEHPTVVHEQGINLFALLGFDPVSKEIIVAYRGTKFDALKQWALDIYAVKTPLTKIEPVLFTSSLRFQFDDLETQTLHRAKVHEGFRIAYEALRDDVFRQIYLLKSRHPDFKRLVFTGHSLGGGLAVLTAIEAAFRFPRHDVRDHIRTYTFGAPRVGNVAFALLFNRLIPDAWQVFNGHEFVPRVPTRAMGFWHVGNVAWYLNNQRIICSNPESRLCFSKEHFWSLTWVEHAFMYFEQPVASFVCTPTDDTYIPTRHDLADATWESRLIAAEERFEYYKNVPAPIGGKPLTSLDDARVIAFADWMTKMLPPNRGLEQLVDNITPTHTQQDFSID